MDENNTVGNTSKNPVPHSSPYFSSSVLRLEEKDYFALDVDICTSLSAICELIGLLRSKQATGAYHVMSWSMYLSSKDPLLPSCSHPVLPSFHASFCHHSFVPFDLSLCASLFLCPSLSQQPSPSLSICLPLPCCIIYSEEMPKIACHYLL